MSAINVRVNFLLTLYAPISQNGQTHSNNSSFSEFSELALKGLRKIFLANVIEEISANEIASFRFPRKIFLKGKLTIKSNVFSNHFALLQ